MFAVFVNFKVHPESYKTFLARMRQQATDSLANEPDCHVFEVWVNDDAPGTVQLYELYASAAAFDVHLQSLHFKAFDKEVADMVLDKNVLTFNRKL